MSKKDIDFVEGKKIKSSYDRWNEAYEALNQQLKHELSKEEFDPDVSNTSKKIAAVTSRQISREFQFIKNKNVVLSQDYGITDLKDKTKPGWKSITAVALTAGLGFGAAGLEAAVPIGGFTGATAGGLKMASGIANASSGAGGNITHMMEKLESSSQTESNFQLEGMKRAIDEDAQIAKQIEEYAQRRLDEERREADEKYRTAEAICR